MSSKEQIQQLRQILDAVAEIEYRNNDAKEIILDEQLSKLAIIPKEGILEALERAIGSSKKRKKASILIFTELYDIDGIESKFRKLLLSSDPAEKNIIIQTIGYRKLRQFVPILNKMLEDGPDSSSDYSLIHNLGLLADDRSFPLFLKLAKDNNPQYKVSLVSAFKNFAKPEGKFFLEQVFNEEGTAHSTKVIAAWGLVKIGDLSYFTYLVRMLDDPDISTPNSYSPGESLRAAQAICDIGGWQFEWNKKFVAITRQRLHNESAEG